MRDHLTAIEDMLGCTLDEARASFRRALDLIGYRPPSWWQFWRWGEALPSPYSEGK